jgi:hypothetical protein
MLCKIKLGMDPIGQFINFWDDLSDPAWWAPKWLKDNPLFIGWGKFWLEDGIDNDLNSNMWNYSRGMREIWNTFYNNFSEEIEKAAKNQRLSGFPVLYLKDDHGLAPIFSGPKTWVQ